MIVIKITLVIPAAKVARRIRVVLTFIALLQLNSDFNKTLAVIRAVTNPDVFQTSPLIIAFLNREPRPSHKVHAFKSQAEPNVVKTDSLECAAGYQRL